MNPVVTCDWPDCAGFPSRSGVLALYVTAEEMSPAVSVVVHFPSASVVPL
jgi:hypothetical protein